MSELGVVELGTKFVALVNEGREGEAALVDEHYAEGVVTIEGAESEDLPARLEGIDALRGKHEWWFNNNEVHGTLAEGPFVGLRADQFAVRFVLDVTPNGGERMQMTEFGLFTVADGKIVQEEFLYLMA